MAIASLWMMNDDDGVGSWELGVVVDFAIVVFDFCFLLFVANDNETNNGSIQNSNLNQVTNSSCMLNVS